MNRKRTPVLAAILVVVALGSAVGIGLFGEQVPLLVIGSFAVSARLALPVRPVSTMIVPVSAGW